MVWSEEKKSLFQICLFMQHTKLRTHHTSHGRGLLATALRVQHSRSKVAKLSLLPPDSTGAGELK